MKQIIKSVYFSFIATKKNIIESYESHSMHRREIRKFNDSRRLAIANQYLLTKEQKEQIDELYINNYGEKVDYRWHQNYAAHSGKFDYRYFPELLYIPEFEAYQNQNTAVNQILMDKNFLPIVAKGAGVKMPKTIMNCTNGIYRDSEERIITPAMALDLLRHNEGGFFIKPAVDSCSGVGCLKCDESSRIEINSDDFIVNGNKYSHDFVVQELIECHESIQKLNNTSVNTFRVITYIWHDKVEFMPVIIRIGQSGSFIDNAHAGGMFCAVNNDGTMGDHAVTEFNTQYKCHPQSGVTFSEHKILYMDRVLDAAKIIHESVPQLCSCNWDFTINKEGEPILIEANCTGGSCWLPQMAHGTGPFGERTEEVLQWLRFMKKLKPVDRIAYKAGRMG